MEPETGYVPNNPLFGVPLDSPQVSTVLIAIMNQREGEGIAYFCLGVSCKLELKIEGIIISDDYSILRIGDARMQEFSLDFHLGRFGTVLVRVSGTQIVLQVKVKVSQNIGD